MDAAMAFVEDMDEDAFVDDGRTVRAVVRCLEVIGEATKQIPDDLRGRHARIPWRQMAGMRDRLIHAYRDVDVGLVWQTVTDEIPAVRSKLVKILEEQGHDSS